MSLAYRPYNDIAADLLMTAPSRVNQGREHWQLTVGDDGREQFITKLGCHGLAVRAGDRAEAAGQRSGHG